MKPSNQDVVDDDQNSKSFVFTSEQIKKLEEFFQNNAKFISLDKRRELSIATKIPEEQIQKWFTNQRLKDVKLNITCSKDQIGNNMVKNCVPAVILISPTPPSKASSPKSKITSILEAGNAAKTDNFVLKCVPAENLISPTHPTPKVPPPNSTNNPSDFQVAEEQEGLYLSKLYKESTQPHPPPIQHSDQFVMRHIDIADSGMTSVHSGPENLKISSPNKKNNHRVYKCEYPNCQKVYSKSSHLIAHIRTHTGMLLHVH